MAMKPLPRLILIIATVGVIAYGLKYIGDREIASRPDPVASTGLQPASDALPVDQYAKPDQAQPAPVQPSQGVFQEPAQPVSAPAQDSGNAGLSKLLNSGAKK